MSLGVAAMPNIRSLSLWQVGSPKVLIWGTKFCFAVTLSGCRQPPPLTPTRLLQATPTPSPSLHPTSSRVPNPTFLPFQSMPWYEQCTRAHKAFSAASNQQLPIQFLSLVLHHVQSSTLRAYGKALGQFLVVQFKRRNSREPLALPFRILALSQ